MLHRMQGKTRFNQSNQVYLMCWKRFHKIALQQTKWTHWVIINKLTKLIVQPLKTIPCHNMYHILTTGSDIGSISIGCKLTLTNWDGIHSTLFLKFFCVQPIRLLFSQHPINHQLLCTLANDYAMSATENEELRISNKWR